MLLDDLPALTHQGHTANNGSIEWGNVRSPSPAMVKSLLALVLLSSQLLSWNASPLFVCLGPDGSICLDFGPASCGCCRPQTADADCCASEHAQHDDHGQDDSCPCTHVQISDVQTATLNRAPAAPDAHRLVASLSVAGNLSSAGCIPTTSRTAVPIVPLDLPSAALCQRSSIVLRC